VVAQKVGRVTLVATKVNRFGLLAGFCENRCREKSSGKLSSTDAGYSSAAWALCVCGRDVLLCRSCATEWMATWEECGGTVRRTTGKKKRKVEVAA
jgi:hypothetical protein